MIILRKKGKFIPRLLFSNSSTVVVNSFILGENNHSKLATVNKIPRIDDSPRDSKSSKTRNFKSKKHQNSFSNRTLSNESKSNPSKYRSSSSIISNDLINTYNKTSNQAINEVFGISKDVKLNTSKNKKSSYFIKNVGNNKPQTSSNIFFYLI